jgi:hypothetical protein
VSSIALLMGLLVLAHLGTRKARAGSGGVELVALGFLLGPLSLGIATRGLVELFEPVAEVGVAWLALVAGLRRGPAIPGLGLRSGTLAAVVSAGAVFLTAAALLGEGDRWTAAAPVAVAIAVAADAGIGLFALAFLFPPAGALASAPIALGGGAAFGGIAAMLLQSPVFRGGEAEAGHHPAENTESMGVVLGAAMVVIGLAARLGLSSMAAAWAMGLSLRTFPMKEDLRRRLAATEQPVALPAMLLAGAQVDWPDGAVLAIGAIAGLAFGARMFARRFIVPALPWNGALSVAVGLSLALRFPGAAGQIPLAVAGLAALAEELIR